MASFTERIRLIFDVDANGAKRGFGDFGKSVREADGLFGKAKAGASSIVSTLKDNMGAVALGAGAALTAFGVKAVAAFSDTAKAASDASKATGLSVEEASRWIAVADDMGVSAESLVSGVGKIAKTLDAGKWEKYGIATRDASGHARSANDVLLDALDVLGKTTNETERARIGNDLFGKGYAQLAPLVGKTRAEYEKWLGGVEKGQVITEKERAKAEKFRRAMDDLQDALKEVALAFGETVAGLAPLLNLIAKALGPVAELSGALGVMIEDVNKFDPSNAFGGAGLAADKAVLKFAGMQKGIRDASGELTTSIGVWDDYDHVLRTVSSKLDEARQRTDGLYASIVKLRGGQLDAESAMFGYQNALDKVWTTTDDATTSVNEHTQAVHDAEKAAEDYARALAAKSGAEEGSTENTRLQIAALNDMVAKVGPDSELGKRLQAYIDQLNSIPGAVATNVTATVPGGVAGGPVYGANTPSGTAPITNNFYINHSGFVDPVRLGREITNAQQAYFRSGGKRAV